MHATSLIAAIFGLASLAAAGVLPAGVLPTDVSAPASDSSIKSVSVAEASQECGNDQVISCCNSTESDSTEGFLLAASVADSLLGGNCQPISIALIQVPLNQACGDNTAACCSGDQTGLVNLQCNPINLL